MRDILQPGPPAPERIQWVEARGRAFSFTLEAGLPLLEAARRGFATEGFAGGTLNIRGGALGPFAYVMPALSKTGENAAYYSDTFRPARVTRLKVGAMTLGQRDGAPFFHCHALWTEADGRAGGGHILPEETVVAEPFAVEAFGIDGAVFAAEPDPETNFKLFGPVPSAATGAKTTSRSRCACVRTRILPARWKGSAATGGSPVQSSMAASAASSAPALPMAASSSPLPLKWRSARARSFQKQAAGTQQGWMWRSSIISTASPRGSLSAATIRC